MAIFAVEYNYVTDRDEEMAQVRPTHRAFNGELAEQGNLIAAGPYVGTHDALIVVRAESAEAALELLESDPFNQAGFIAKRTPRQWNPVTDSGQGNLARIIFCPSQLFPAVPVPHAACSLQCLCPTLLAPRSACAPKFFSTLVLVQIRN